MTITQGSRMTINGLLDSACVSSNIQIDNKIRLTVHPNFIREIDMLNGLCFQAFGRCFDIEEASKEIFMGKRSNFFIL